MSAETTESVFAPLAKLHERIEEQRQRVFQAAGIVAIVAERALPDADADADAGEVSP